MLEPFPASMGAVQTRGNPQTKTYQPAFS